MYNNYKVKEIIMKKKDIKERIGINVIYNIKEE